MIVLLNYSTSWSKSNYHISSTGELTGDSVLVSFDDLRRANAKMIELKYEKEINDSLRSIITKDNIIISEYNNVVNDLNKKINKENKKYRMALYGGSVISIALAILLVFK